MNYKYLKHKIYFKYENKIYKVNTIKHCIIKCKNTYTYSSNQNWKVLEGQLWMEKMWDLEMMWDLEFNDKDLSLCSFV